MKTLLRGVLWITGGFVGFCAFGAGALYVHFAEPHIAYREWRNSEAPETISVVYVFYACGEHTPRLYEITSADGDPLQWNDKPVIPALPQGIPSPEDTALAVNWNKFRLTGYTYQAERRNRLTGSVRTFPSTRFDLVSWEAQIPYSVWAEETGEPQLRDSPVRYAMASDQRLTAAYIPGSRRIC